jgi:hypothetical protein
MIDLLDATPALRDGNLAGGARKGRAGVKSLNPNEIQRDGFSDF